MWTCCIPRGGAGLIRACVENAEGPLHPDRHRHLPYFVDDSADQTKALDIIENAKASRPASATPEKCALCIRRHGAASSCRSWPSAWPGPRGQGSAPSGTASGQRAAAVIPGTAGPKDFDTEFLDYILAVKVVDSVEEAIAHIAEHSTGHSEAILTRQRRPTLPSSQQLWTARPCTSDLLHPLH